jgi:hypothetical protein
MPRTKKKKEKAVGTSVMAGCLRTRRKKEIFLHFAGRGGVLFFLIGFIVIIAWTASKMTCSIIDLVCWKTLDLAQIQRTPFGHLPSATHRGKIKK